MAKKTIARYNLKAVRTPAQLAKMQELTSKGICAFCPEHFIEYHDNPIEFETRHWIVTKNDYPYDHTKLHLLLITRKHVQKLSQLSKAARADMLEAVTQIERTYKLPSFSIVMRVGDILFNGGSVDHLHAQFIVGDGSPEGVRIKIGSGLG